MKAAVCRAFGEPLVIEEVTLAAPKTGEVEVKIAACAICHSDITYADGAWGGSLPAVYGHEAAGWVQRTGPGVTGFAKGDRVIVTLVRSCGTCPACAGGQPTSCDHVYDPLPSPLSDADGGVMGYGMQTAAFAERVVVDQSQLVHLPDDIELDVASLVACGVITGIGAVTNTARMPAGARIAVIGAGGVGLNTIQGAALSGAAQIIAMDLTPEKLDTAKAFGATHGVIASDGDAVEQVRALCDGRGVDFAFVTVGAGAAFQSAPDLLASGGAVVMVGMTASGVKVDYEPCNLAALNQSILGSRMGQVVLPRDIPWILSMYQQGRLKLDELISGRYALEDINEAIAATKAGISGRNVIIFD